MKTIIVGFITTSIILFLCMAFFISYQYPNLLPSGFTLKYVVDMLTGRLFLRSLYSSIILGVCSAFCSTILGFLIARGVVLYGGKYRDVITTFFTLPLFFPAISMFIGIHVIMLKVSVANSFLGILISHLFLSLPYAMNIGISFFSGIPRELETVSILLGADNKGMIKTIILPLIAAGIGLSASLTFLVSVSEYFATFLIGGGSYVTLAGIMYPYISNFDLQNSAVLSMVFIILNLGVFSISGIFIKKRSYLF